MKRWYLILFACILTGCQSVSDAINHITVEPSIQHTMAYMEDGEAFFWNIPIYFTTSASVVSLYQVQIPELEQIDGVVLDVENSKKTCDALSSSGYASDTWMCSIFVHIPKPVQNLFY